MVVLVGGGAYLLSEYWTSLANNWFVLLVLACPLMHLFMHGGHGSHGSHHSGEAGATTRQSSMRSGPSAATHSDGQGHPADAASADASGETFLAATVPTQEKRMLEFEVKDMTCDHCAARITKALQAADAGVSVDIDVPAHRVRVVGALDADSARKAIVATGYTPVVLHSH
jgi:copper chaperone